MMPDHPVLSALRPGFADPVFESQAISRAVMQAMARPGLPVRIASDLRPPAPLTVPSTAIVLTLCDFETPLWLDSRPFSTEARRYLRFHCGCPLATSPEDAVFALIADPRHMPSLAEFGQGTDEYPDRSATLILQVQSLSQGSTFRLSGPGIKGATELSVLGLPAWFPAAWKLNHAQYPVGIDVILADSDRIAGLPRSTRLEQ